MSWSSNSLFILLLYLHNHYVWPQSTMETDLFTSTSTTAIPIIEDGNFSAISLDLDEILAVVNRSESLTPTVIPPGGAGSGYGERMFMHAMNDNYNKADLMGRTLRVVVPKIEPPYINYVNFSDAERLARGYGPGVVIEILKEMSRNLNVTYEIIDAPEQAWGAYENGNWTGAFGMMFRGEADILAGAAIMQYDRGLITDLTFPFQYAPTAMLIRSPEKYNDNTWLIVTQPFKGEVWGLTAVSIAISGIVLFFFVRFLKIAGEVQFSLVESLWIFFSVTVQQGLPVQPRSWSCRVMLAMWWLAAITWMATFTGSLVALFAVDKTNMPFTNIQQLVKLVEKGSWTIVMDGSTLTRTNMIRESESAIYKSLWYEMSVNRKVTYVKGGIEAGISLVLSQPNEVLLGPEDSLKFYATIDCRLTKLQEGILPTYLSIPVSKDSEYSTYMSKMIRDLVERGFIDKWINDYTSYMVSKKTNYKCASTNQASDKYLDLSKAQGAFWVLIGGFILGFTFITAEFMFRGIWKIYESRKGDDTDSIGKNDLKRKAKHSNTTSSLSSEETGGEPEILKLDSRVIESYQAAIGKDTKYEGTRF